MDHIKTRLQVIELRKAINDRVRAHPGQRLLDAYTDACRGEIEDERFEWMRKETEPGVRRYIVALAAWIRQARAFGCRVSTGISPLALVATVVSVPPANEEEEVRRILADLLLDPRRMGLPAKVRSQRLKFWVDAQVAAPLLQDLDELTRAAEAQQDPLAWHPEQYAGHYIFATPEEDTSGQQRSSTGP